MGVGLVELRPAVQRQPPGVSGTAQYSQQHRRWGQSIQAARTGGTFHVHCVLRVIINRILRPLPFHGNRQNLFPCAGPQRAVHKSLEG